MPVKVLFVSHTFDHMGKFSGYDRLGDYLKGNAEIDFVSYQKRKLYRFQQNIINKRLSRTYTAGKYGLFHSYDRYLTEYNAVMQSKKLHSDIIHLAYLEDSLGYISDKRKKIKAKIVATSHQPPSWWLTTNKNTSLLQCLDALIVLSSEAQSFFEQFIPEKVFFIPHGIDAHFFSPDNFATALEKRNRCLFVGNWLRDFNALAETVKLINETESNIQFDIVFPQAVEMDHPLFRLLKYSNVSLHKNIDDQSLLSLYRNAKILLLPLIDCTANNALLEAAACQVPIITNRKGGVLDYLNDQLVYITENNSPVNFREKINFIFDTSNCEKVKINAEKQRGVIAEKFSWEIIASQMVKLYQSL